MEKSTKDPEVINDSIFLPDSWEFYKRISSIKVVKGSKYFFNFLMIFCRLKEIFFVSIFYVTQTISFSWSIVWETIQLRSDVCDGCWLM